MSGGLTLSFDTATTLLTVAVANGEVRSEATIAPAEDGRPRHATALLDEVERAVSTAGGWDEISLLGVGVGPGTFTGLRIGVATARALAQGHGIPLTGVSSLATLAEGAGAPEVPLLCAIDAKRSEMFAELRDPSGTVMWPARAITPGALADELGPLPNGTRAIGDGALRFRVELEGAGATVPDDRDPVHRVSAAALCRLAGALEASEPSSIVPNYLRRPDAELWRQSQAAAR